VLTRCRQYALDAAEPYGIWGGMSPLERALLTPLTQLTGQTRPRETAVNATVSGPGSLASFQFVVCVNQFFPAGFKLPNRP